MTLENTKDVLAALRCVRIDLEMLQTGEWVPDNDSCEASIEILESAIEYISRNLS